MSRSTRSRLTLTLAAGRRLAFSGALGMLVVLAGCGADTRRAGTQPAATTASATATGVQPGPAVATDVTDPQRRAYVARVDRICARLDPERTAVDEQVSKSADARDAAVAYEKTISLGGSQLRQIEAVPAPPRDRAALSADVFAVISRQLVIRRQIKTALAAADLTRLQSLRLELDGLTRSLAAFARGYGFRVCGEE